MLFTMPKVKQPKFYVSVTPKNGETQDITHIVTGRLIEIKHTDNRGYQADNITIVLDDSDNSLAIPSNGAVLTLALGYEGEALTYKGDFILSSVRHDSLPYRLTLTAQTADLTAGVKNKKERSFHQKTIKQIVEEIAKDHGLTPVISQTLATERVQHIDQTNEGDFNFLTRLADEYDAITTIKSKRLLFLERGSALTASGQKMPIFYIKREECGGHSFSKEAGEDFKAVKAYWHDVKTGKRGEVVWDEKSKVTKKTKPTMQKKTKVKRGKDGNPIKGANGKSVKETVFVKGKGRQVNQVTGTQSHESEAIRTLSRTYMSEQSAINGAKRAFAKAKRGKMSFELSLAEGNATLTPECAVKVVGFKPEIDEQDWVIVSVENSVGKNEGFQTHLKLEVLNA